MINYNNKLIDITERFLLLNGINLSNDFFYIKDIKIPNFSIYPNIKWEFYHQILELYGNYLTNNNFLYETNKIYINKNDIILDCGANLGLFSAYAATKGKQVFSFEPSKKNLNFLNKTKLYYSNMQIINQAVFMDNQIKTFLETDNIGASHLKDININFSNINKEIIAQTISLDYFCLINKIIPSFIKMDIEGAEKEALLGSKKILQNYKPKLVISTYHLKNDFNIIKQIIYNFNKEYIFFTDKNKKILFAY